MFCIKPAQIMLPTQKWARITWHAALRHKVVWRGWLRSATILARELMATAKANLDVQDRVAGHITLTGTSAPSGPVGKSSERKCLIKNS